MPRSKDHAGRSPKHWDLEHVPKSLFKSTLQHFFVYCALRVKLNGTKKLTWKSEDSFQANKTKFQ